MRAQENTINILSIGTDRSEEKVQTGVRLHLMNIASDQSLSSLLEM